MLRSGSTWLRSSPRRRSSCADQFPRTMLRGLLQLAPLLHSNVGMTARALDFFAGSGLARLGLEPEFRTVWANDICPKKGSVYDANTSGPRILIDSISNIRGRDIPSADLAWASFPCQDLSLAGNLTGIGAGTRSGLFWEWIRLLDELGAAERRPPLLALENVVGFLIAQDGAHFVRAYEALRTRGYRAGAVVIDARDFVPQSRPRAFLIAVDRSLPTTDLAQERPGHFHPGAVIAAAAAVADTDWIWWTLPPPAGRVGPLADLCDWRAPCDSARRTNERLAMLSPTNKRKLEQQLRYGRSAVGTGYCRTRPTANGRTQRLEIRFDGVAGCLRTPKGGSSRQVVLLVDQGAVHTRLMTVRECARLMGAPDSYEIPGAYNDGYRAMGDAVVVPVVRWLTRHLLGPLILRSQHAPRESAA